MGHHIERSLDGWLRLLPLPSQTFPPSFYFPLLPARLLVCTMAKLSLTFPPPAGAESVPGDQTQARLEEFRQMPWREPDWEDATLTALQGVERYWHSYVFPSSPVGG